MLVSLDFFKSIVDRIVDDVKTIKDKLQVLQPKITGQSGQVVGFDSDGNVVATDKPSYTAHEVGADPSGTASSQVASHNTLETSHSDIRLLIQGLSDRLSAVADADHSKLANRDAADQHPMSAITGLERALEGKQAAGNYLTDKDLDATLTVEGKAADAAAVGARLDSLSEEMLTEESDPTVPSWAKAAQKPSYTAQEVGALPATTHIPSTAADVNAEPSGAVAQHNVSDAAHSDIRLLIQGLSERLSSVADSDDTTLDQLSEIVAYIKSNKSLIDAITTSKVNVADIVDNLTTNVANKPLSAAQGVALKAIIDALTIPTALSDLTDDTTHRVVTDAEKAEWNAKSNFTGSYNDLTDKPTIPEAYTLHIASSTVLGGVKPVDKTDAMTQSVGVDAAGALWTAAGGGGSSSEAYSVEYTTGEMTEDVDLVRLEITDNDMWRKIINADYIKIEGTVIKPSDGTTTGKVSFGLASSAVNSAMSLWVKYFDNQSILSTGKGLFNVKFGVFLDPKIADSDISYNGDNGRNAVASVYAAANNRNANINNVPTTLRLGVFKNTSFLLTCTTPMGAGTVFTVTAIKE